MASHDTASPLAIHEWMDGFTDVHIDLGTGDGAYALHMARTTPGMAVIGVDTCLDNLTKAARKGLPNLRFVQGDATDPPAWLHGGATSVSINFPFGSLLRVLAEGDAEAHRRLFAVARPGAGIEIRINGSAAKELHLPPDVVRDRLQHLIRSIGASAASVTIEPHGAFRRFPSTWAKRLAFGRPSQVVVATATVSR